ncbi:hypothetical protein JDS99_04655 [Bacillus cereus group sp. N6]|uniref:hypothetical protein n=1 Tax=Bacillus cereus group sp. N6 TaxID=2794583 RepID=UPI0018F6A8E9|nr:hypothetical protein [Bacillus cereus group sp. N6]MBJ8108954.1 hypothetical protein [Bacillus cereus group sp. N6]
MAKVARDISRYKVVTTNPISGHNIKKVRDAVLKEMDEFEKGFPDGVYVKPSSKKEPRVKVKALFQYCNERNIQPNDLTEEEREQFLVYE